MNKATENFSSVKLISINFFTRKIYVQNKHKKNKKKTKLIKPKLSVTLNQLKPVSPAILFLGSYH